MTRIATSEVFEFRRLRCDLTESELNDKKTALAELSKELLDALNEKASANIYFTSKIKELNSKIAAVTQLIYERFEFREIECAIDYNFPENGMKTVRRKDTNSIVSQSKMTDEEIQQHNQIPLTFVPIEEDKPNEVSEAKKNSSDMT